MKAMPIVLSAALAIALAQSVSAEEENPLAKVEGADDLEKVSDASFRETYVNTNADFTKYNKLYPGPAVFHYRDAGPAKRYRTTPLRSNQTEFGISEKDRADFENIVDEAFEKELGKSEYFTMSEELGPETMIVRGAMVDVVSRVPPEFVGRGEVYLATVGEATLILEFLDGSTGEVLARVAERRRIDTIGGRTGMATMPTNTVTVRSDVKRWASSTAKRLRNELDLAISGH